MAAEPIPFICYGLYRDLAESVHEILRPQFSYAAIMTPKEIADIGAPADVVLRTLLHTLNPAPRGIVMGGHESAVVEEVQKVVNEWNRTRPADQQAKVLVVPAGEFHQHGKEHIKQFVRQGLLSAHGMISDTK